VRATQHLRSGKYVEAIECLHLVIGARKDAVESHLLLGTAYLNGENDPISAMYFLKKYAHMCQDQKQKLVAERLMDTATKEFLKTLPAHNGVAQNEAELTEILKALKLQNAALRDKIAAYEQKIAECEERIDVLSENVLRLARAKSNSINVVHIVESGETLSSIGHKYYGNPNSWRKIFEANGDSLKTPSDIKVGQKLTIP
jgi:nucleoid-associated protein YgaU